MDISRYINKNRADKGFTLIEVLIALAIFSIGILAVASMQLSARLQSRSSAEITEASAIASGQMEELMLRPFDHADLDPVLNPHQLTLGKYAIQWMVIDSDLNGDTINDSKTVELTASYNMGSNQRQITMFFIKHDQ